MGCARFDERAHLAARRQQIGRINEDMFGTLNRRRVASNDGRVAVQDRAFVPVLLRGIGNAIPAVGVVGNHTQRQLLAAPPMTIRGCGF